MNSSTLMELLLVASCLMAAAAVRPASTAFHVFSIRPQPPQCYAAGGWKMCSASGKYGGKGINREPTFLQMATKESMQKSDSPGRVNKTFNRNKKAGNNRWTKRIKIDYETIDATVQKAFDHMDNLTMIEMRQVWTHISKLLNSRPMKNPSSNDDWNQQQKQLSHQLDELLSHTMSMLETCDQRDLTQTVMGLAKIVDNLRKDRKRRQIIYHEVFYNLLFDRSSMPKDTIFQPIADASIPILPAFDARHLSNLVYAYALVGFVPMANDGKLMFDQVAQNAILNLGSFNSQDISNMLWAYATVGYSHPLLFDKSGNEIAASSDLRTFKSQEISNILWAFAKGNEPHTRLFKMIADRIVASSNSRKFKPQDFANIFWAYATVNDHHHHLFEKLADEIVESHNLRSFKPKELSNIVWACAKANESYPLLFQKIANGLVESHNLRSFNSQDFANIVWAYATSNEQHPLLFEKIAKEIISSRNLQTFKPQELANIAWAYATAKECYPHLFEKISHNIVTSKELHGFKHQELSNIVWAYATAKESDTRLFQKIADVIVEYDDLHLFKPQALANVAWAYATANESHPRLFKKIAESIISTETLESFDSQALAITAWAFATARQPYPIMFEKIADSAIVQQTKFNSQCVANLLWAFSVEGLIEPQLFSSLAPTAAAIIDKSNSQELGTIAWAYAVANVDAAPLFGNNAHFLDACLEKINDFNIEEQRQLHQWQLWREELKSNVRLPPELHKRCYTEFISVGYSKSRFQNDVVSELRAIGLEPDEEVLAQSGYRLDALVKVNGKIIPIEVDGPSHFIGRDPTGSTILKRRQVSNLDCMTIVSVPYWDWQKLGRSHDEKQQYLRSLLKLSAGNSTMPNQIPIEGIETDSNTIERLDEISRSLAVKEGRKAYSQTQNQDGYSYGDRVRVLSEFSEENGFVIGHTNCFLWVVLEPIFSIPLGELKVLKRNSRSVKKNRAWLKST